LQRVFDSLVKESTTAENPVLYDTDAIGTDLLKNENEATIVGEKSMLPIKFIPGESEDELALSTGWESSKVVVNIPSFECIFTLEK
jgi:hypothetical protein